MSFVNLMLLEITANGQVLPMVGNFIFVRPEQLLIKNMLMKLRTKVESCLSCLNYSLDLHCC